MRAGSSRPRNQELLIPLSISCLANTKVMESPTVSRSPSAASKDGSIKIGVHPCPRCVMTWADTRPFFLGPQDDQVRATAVGREREMPVKPVPVITLQVQNPETTYLLYRRFLSPRSCSVSHWEKKQEDEEKNVSRSLSTSCICSIQIRGQQDKLHKIA